MNLTFQKIKIDNFMCFDKEQFDFESNMGISLITGTNNDIPGSKNGCGKSSLINAFIFALFGKMLNQTSLRSISNRHLPVRDTEIVLHFKADDVPFVIVSGIGISPFKSYCKLYKHSISKQNDLTKHSTRETRLYIEKNILKTDFEVFLRSFVLTSDQAYSFFSMKKQDKRTFIENIFDLKIFGEMYRNIHRDNLENEKELTAIERVAYTQRNDISEMKEKKEDAGNTSQEDVLTEEVKKLKESIEEKKRLISRVDIEKVEKGIQSLNNYITGVNSRKESIKIQITNKNQLINNILKKEYSDKISYVKKYIDTYNELSEHSKPIVSKKLGLDEVKEQAKDLVKKIKEESELLKKLKEKESKLVVGDDIHKKLKKLKEAKKKVEEEKALIKELAFQQIKFGNELRKVKDGVDLIDDLLIKKREDLDKTQEELDNIAFLISISIVSCCCGGVNMLKTFIYPIRFVI